MHTETRDGVLTITFDRPDVMNAFTVDTAIDLSDAVTEADPDDHDAVVLTGEGSAFSAGGDIKSMAEREETVRDAYDRVEESFGRVVEEIMECPVPVVAKVNGDAIGAGLAVAAVCDFAYAAESARFSCAFVRVGLVPDTGGTFLLPHLVGLREAKRLAFTADFIDAGEAADIDLINDAVPGDHLDETVDELLDTLRKRPTRTLGLTKQAMHENLGREWEQALDYENMIQSHAYDTPEHEEGVSAFLEGREPEF